MFLKRVWQAVAEMRRMPKLSVDLMVRAASDNDPFYGRIVREYYADCRRRHYFVLRRNSFGVAVCSLPPTFDDYFMLVEASARRNFKKAQREGCHVERITYNDHLEAIREVRMSADVRQGKPMPEEYRSGIVRPNTDPPSRNPVHDYPHFGVFAKDKLVGYAGCFVAGEIAMLEHILGHADHLTVGAVPQLIIGIARHLYTHHPQVRYYAYGTYFGAGEGLRRFKRKFGFLPHQVKWHPGETEPQPTAVGNGPKAEGGAA